jgi:NADH-quinone oxidoreductase subunit N
MNAIILTAVWGVVMMLAGAFIKNAGAAKYWAITGLVIITGATGWELVKQDSFFAIDVKEMLQFTSYNLTFLVIMFVCTLLYFLLNGKDIEKVGKHPFEYFALIFFILCGVSLTASFNTLLLLFIGIEIVSIPLYILTGSDKRNLKSNEASLKYFLMGSFSTGIMLMGIAFLYGGSDSASLFLAKLSLGMGKLPVLTAAGLILLLISMSFKVSAAPFHFWTPDVYDGAPTVFTSFMATIVKAAGFFAFLHLFEKAFGAVQDQWQKLIIIITAATLLIGNLTAVFQQSVKRMLAYSSIAQAGFMLFALFAVNDRAKEGLVLYAAAYSLASIGIFAILVRMKDFTVDGFNGLAKTEPLLALTATVFLLSLTGIPLTAGFQAKFYMLMAAVENGRQIWLVVFAVLCAAVSAYYYFRVIQAMYFKEANNEAVIDKAGVTAQYKFLLMLTAALIVILGIMPDIIIDWLWS